MPPRFRLAGAALAASFLVLFLAPAAEAATCYAVADGNWNVASTWATSSGGAATGCPLVGTSPGATDDVIIGNARTVTIPTGYSAAAASVTINIPATNATSVLDVGTGSLTVGGSVTIGSPSGQKKAQLKIGTGTATVGTVAATGGGSVTFTGAGTLNISSNFASGAAYTAGTGTVVYNGSGAQSVGAYNYYNLTINKSAGAATTGGNITIGNNLTLTAGTLNIGANTINRGAAGGTLTLAGDTTLQIASANFPANYATEAIAATSTVEYNPGANITVPAKGYGNLLLSNSGNRNFNSAMTIAGNLTLTGTVAAVMNAGITVNGNLDVGNGTTFDAKTYSHVVKGNFTTNTTGALTPGTSTFTFNGASAQTLGGGATSFYNFVANNSAGVTTGVNLSIGGNFTNTAGFNAGATTTTFNGTAAQAITGATTFYNLVMNNAAGLTINDDVTVGDSVTGGALTLTSGNITTGTNTLIVGTTASCSVTRTSGHVNGRLLKNFTTTLTTCAFEIGDSVNYTPVTVELSPVTAAGTLTASTIGTDHPQIGDSIIDGAQSVNRYWTLTPGGLLAFTNATLTFNYIGGSPVDLDSGVTPADFIVQRYGITSGSCATGSGAWNNTTISGTPTSTEASATGVSTFGTICSQFAIGTSTVRAFSREREWVYQRELYY